MLNSLRKFFVVFIISPLSILPVCALCYLYAGIEKYTSIDALISDVVFGVLIGMGSLFYFYFMMLVYGLSISLLLQKLNLFKLPVVLVVSILPVLFLNLFAQFNREIVVLYLLALSTGVTGWYIYNKVK